MEKEEDYFEIFFAITYSQIILMHFAKPEQNMLIRLIKAYYSACILRL